MTRWQQAQAEPASGTERGFVALAEFAQLPREGPRQAAYSSCGQPTRNWARKTGS